MKQKEKASTKRNIPSLRFPEFRNAGEWEEKRLREVCELISGLHLSPDQYSSSGSIPYFTGPSDFTNFVHLVSKWTEESSNMAFKKDILITVKGSGVGELLSLELQKVVMGRQLMAVKPTRISNSFLFQFLSKKRSRFEDLSSGNLIPGLSRSDILNLEISLPSLPEQQKIADCLSSLDEVISLEFQKHNALKSFKKGLLQQLFPSEGESVPRLRFPEFQDEGEWEAVNGDFLFESVSNKNHDSNLPILAITQEHGAIPRHLIDYQISVTDKSIESYKVVEPGDFIISLRSFQGGIEYSNYFGICSPAYIILRKKKILHDHFYRYFFKTANFVTSLNKNIEGIRDGKMVSFKQFSELNIPFPSLAEQQKIADCFSSIDESISLQSQKLEELKLHRKGLLQQLFSEIGE